MTKAGMRARILERRNAMPPRERRARADRIIARLCALEEFSRARTVMAYSGFGSEIDTLPLLREILTLGKKLVLPRVSREQGMLVTYLVENLQDNLQSGTWGILEPNLDRCAPIDPVHVDLVIMPGVAFDRQGGRLGYGKGYYDKLLAACMTRGFKPVTVAAAFSDQLVESVPMEGHDVRVDVLVTEDEVLEPDNREHAARGPAGAGDMTAFKPACRETR